MINRRQFLAKAGSILGLPFLWPVTDGRAVEAQARDGETWAFEKFTSSCIDLANYDRKTQRLTVRFVGRKAEKFYRYSNVLPEVWEKLNRLNESGGVGGYLNDTVVRDPKKYPFEELFIRGFKIAPKKRKAGNSK